MARDGFITAEVSRSLNGMFNDFLREKQLKKATAMGEAIELYMMAMDEELYIKLKKEYLNVENVINLVADRKGVDSPDFIFIKLGDNDYDLNGSDTMKEYVEDQYRNGSTWFSTQSLHLGMKKERVNFYNNLIKQGVPVKMLFALTKGTNDSEIAYCADVLEVRSDREPLPAPDKNCPARYHDTKAKIWIKLHNLKKEEFIKANMLQISSTGRDLKDTILRSQYGFGYVSFKEQ